MSDEIKIHSWPEEGLPDRIGVWPINTGFLTAGVQSHYHWRPNYVCPHLVVGGAGEVMTRHGTATLSTGDMFCLWPGVDIDYRADPTRPWQFYWVHVIGPGDRTFAEACGFLADRPTRRPAHPELVTVAFRALHAATDAPTRDPYGALARLFALAEACRKPLTPTSETRARATEARIVVDLMPQNDFNVAELANALGVSRNTLHRAFIAEMGVSPSAFLQQTRLARAKEHLTATDASLATIARAVGFSSDKYFLRAFRAAEGMTPTEWRKRQRDIG